MSARLCLDPLGKLTERAILRSPSFIWKGNPREREGAQREEMEKREEMEREVRNRKEKGKGIKGGKMEEVP